MQSNIAINRCQIMAMLLMAVTNEEKIKKKKKYIEAL